MSNKTQMQVINRGGKEIIFVQGSDAPNSVMAIVDTAGWVTIGHIGDDHLILDADDWPKFVKFINEIEAYLSKHGLPIYETVMEQRDESV